MNEIKLSKRLAVGSTIKGLRISKGWTQKTLARKMGWKQPHAAKIISKIEQGIQNTSPESIADFAEVFGVGIEYLSKEHFPTEIRLEAVVSFQGDLRPILRKVSELHDSVSVKELFEALEHYCSLKSSGIEV